MENANNDFTMRSQAIAVETLDFVKQLGSFLIVQMQPSSKILVSIIHIERRGHRGSVASLLAVSSQLVIHRYLQQTAF